MKARPSRTERMIGFQPSEVLKGLARPDVGIRRTAGSGGLSAEPTAMSGIIEGAKEAGRKVDTGLELLDIDALDTGQYHAMVIQDPDDKKNIRGFLHLGVVYTETIDAREISVHYAPWGSQFYRRIQALTNLLRAINEYTDIRADIWPRYSFSSREIFRTPWVLVSIWTSFKLARSEADNVGEYLAYGGFVFADNFWPSYLPGYTPLREMFEDVLATQGWVSGRDWTFEKLPDDHPVYHCYFDFDGAPIGGDAVHLSRPVGERSATGQVQMLFYLEGVPLDGRLAGILSNKVYVDAWGRCGPREGQIHMENTRQLQFGVNLVIFALTQEGSITHQLMESLH